eukprot:21231-Heterococcus_DN1.PRE.6
MQSAAAGPQAEAMLAAARRWGAGPAGAESLCVSVCKRKHQPWKAGQLMYGCHLHDAARSPDHDACMCINRTVYRATIQAHGFREGWEPFDQWDQPETVAAATDNTDEAVVETETLPPPPPAAAAAAAAAAIAEVAPAAASSSSASRKRKAQSAAHSSSRHSSSKH